MPRRFLITAASLLAAVGLGVALLTLLVSRDEATVQTAGAPGMEVPAQDGQGSEILRAGNVILVAGRGQAGGARGLARALTGGDATGALRRAGQAVLVREGPGRGGVVAVAWRHQLRAENAQDPALTAFVEYWLGRGA